MFKSPSREMSSFHNTMKTFVVFVLLRCLFGCEEGGCRRVPLGVLFQTLTCHWRHVHALALSLSLALSLCPALVCHDQRQHQVRWHHPVRRSQRTSEQLLSMIVCESSVEQRAYLF